MTGEWTGIWSSYNPAQPAVPPKEQCKSLSAKVAKKGDGYEATFEGDCGRPYKYNITMEGRAAGKTVLFKGTADLGPKDGGVYDWIGRATDKEFVGFYTNAYYTGVFTLTRKYRRSRRHFVSAGRRAMGSAALAAHQKSERKATARSSGAIASAG